MNLKNKILFLLVGLLLQTGFLSAQEFIVKDFEAKPRDVAGYEFEVLETSLCVAQNLYWFAAIKIYGR
jgi:hypothetical protein